MNSSIKEASEMYAVGSISLTQVAEVVERFPLAQQAKLMEEAMHYADFFYQMYEEWMEKQEKKHSSSESETN
jgi:hypothetical protein